MGTQLSIFDCLGGCFTFSTFSEKDHFEFKSNQSKSIKKLNGHNVSILIVKYEPFYLWNISVQNSSLRILWESSFGFLLLPFLWRKFILRNSFWRKFFHPTTPSGFYPPATSTIIFMLRWIYGIFFKLWSVIRKLHQIFFNKQRRHADKIPAWEFWNVFSTTLGIMRFNVMEVTLSHELSKLIVCQRELKNKIEKQIIFSIIFTMTVAFSAKLSFGLLFVTLCILAATFIYITISMQDSITDLQRNLFTICYQQLHPQDSQERQEPLGQ